MITNTCTTDIVYLPDAPTLPGLRFRHFGGESDYTAMVAVLRASKKVDHIEEVETVEDLANSYAHLLNCDPYKDVLCAEINGQHNGCKEMIGYNRVYWCREDEGNWIYAHFGFLLPEWRQRGIGRAMLRHSERRLRQIAAKQQVDGPRFFQTEANNAQTGLEAMLHDEGYQPVRHEYEMLRDTLQDIPAAPLPAGLELRPALPEHHRLIWQAMNEAFRDHWGYRAGSEQEYQQWINNPHNDLSLWQVAWDGDQIAGMVLGVINPNANAEYNRKQGWVDDVCVCRPWRKRGLAHALLARCLQAFREHGMTEAALGVDTENTTGALRVYERIGFHPAKRFTVYRKPLE